MTIFCCTFSCNCMSHPIDILTYALFHIPNLRFRHLFNDFVLPLKCRIYISLYNVLLSACPSIPNSNSSQTTEWNTIKQSHILYRMVPLFILFFHLTDLWGFLHGFYGGEGRGDHQVSFADKFS